MIYLYIRGDVMRSFFRFLIVVLFIVTAFVGGWFTSEIIRQDPFLANFLNVETGQYEQLVQDIKHAVEDLRVSDQSELIELLLAKQQATPVFANVQGIGDETSEYLNGELDGDPYAEDEATDDVPYIEEQQLSSLDDFDPNDMVGVIVQQMSTKEKLSFLMWARSRFSNEQLAQIEGLLQNGITADNFLTLYQYTRTSLKGNDYEYLLSFVDRYLNTVVHKPEEATSVFQANESPMNPRGN